jgi:hypothetical protein
MQINTKITGWVEPSPFSLFLETVLVKEVCYGKASSDSELAFLDVADT